MPSKYSITSIDGVCTVVLNEEDREALHNINLTDSEVNLGVSGDMEASGYASHTGGEDER